jgi:endonuclease/exonuclease/phosphatase family metal-dependent hydrolase
VKSCEKNKSTKGKLMIPSKLVVDTANIQFPPYCYLRPDKQSYNGLSEEGKASTLDILHRIGSGDIDEINKAISDSKINIIQGKTLQLTDWTERKERVKTMLGNQPADIVLLQEVSRNKECQLATLDDIADPNIFVIDNYSEFGLKLDKLEDQQLEDVLKRGTGILRNKDLHANNRSEIALTLAKKGKTQTRRACITEFSKFVDDTEIKVRAVSVHITGFWSGAVKNLADMRAKLDENPDNQKMQIAFKKAEAAYNEFLASYNEGVKELTHYLNTLEQNDTFEITLVGGDFNFDPISGDGAVETLECTPFSTSQNKTGILQNFGYSVTDSIEATEGKRRLDYVAYKLSERMQEKFNVTVASHNRENNTGGFLSDHAFVRTEFTFTPKANNASC